MKYEIIIKGSLSLFPTYDGVFELLLSKNSLLVYLKYHFKNAQKLFLLF